MKMLYLAASFSLVPGLALAHTGSGDGAALTAFLHPFSGLDHALAAAAIGIFAASRGGRALWMAPIAYLAALAVGSASSVLSLQMPNIELLLALSVVGLGLLVMAERVLSGALGGGIGAAFALVHGQAHLAELPAGSGAATQFLGVLAGTAVLVSLGVGLALAARSLAASRSGLIQGALGVAIMTAGAALLAGSV